MANPAKRIFLEELQRRVGPLHRLDRTRSLFSLRDDALRVYVRYSKVHQNGVTFYGLRREDLQQLEGHQSLVCFLWDDQEEPLFVPFSDYEEVFDSTHPAQDGQYKAHVLILDGGTQLRIAQAGSFNVEGNLGWAGLETLLGQSQGDIPALSHYGVQTLLGAIGDAKGYDIWVPTKDRAKLDTRAARSLSLRDVPPYGFDAIESILQEIDVIWIQRGSNDIKAFFEVEHSTTIYSGLLRFNDVHLFAPLLQPRFSIVADDMRRSVFVRQINRPTFRVAV